MAASVTMVNIKIKENLITTVLMVNMAAAAVINQWFSS
jgi:hypothetical protein